MHIRKATANDMRTYFAWRNEPGVRAAALTTDPVVWEHHQAWFHNRLTDPNSVLYVIEKETNAMGQVRFEMSDACAEINYSIDVPFRGKGLATDMMQLAMNALLQDCPHIKQFSACVKTDNPASYKVFEKLQFQLQGFDEETQANRYYLNISH